MAAHKDLSGIDLHEPKGIDDATNGQYYAADGAGSGTWTTLPAGLTIPAGIVVDYAGASAPSLWLLCYGQAVSRTTYSALFTAISTNHGVGDGSTTFNLPDYRDRGSIGKGNMGGSAASLVTAAISGITSTTLGAVGGSQLAPDHTHTGTTSSDGAHTHTVEAGSTNDAENGNNVNDVRRGTANKTTSSNGAHTHTMTVGNPNGSAHGGSSANMPPSIVMNKIIYAGV